MEIYWKNDKIEKKIKQLVGQDKIAIKRMINIDSAKNFLDLVPVCNGGAHFLKREMSGYFALYVTRKTDPRRYICEPYGSFKKNQDGSYKKETIVELLILRIEKNYHKN